MKKTIILIFLFLIITTVVQAQDFTYKLNDISEIKIGCTIDGFPCNSSGSCDTTIRYPNGTYIVEDQAMTFINGGDFGINVTFDELGTYTSKFSCQQNGLASTNSPDILVTNTGRVFTDSQGTVALGILIAVLILAFLFLLIGFDLEKNPSTIPIGFLFVVLSLFLGIYSLHLGYTYTVDILAYESMIPVSSGIYTAFLILLSGIVVISAALMLVAMIRELGKINKTKKFGVGFNPITDSYDF